MSFELDIAEDLEDLIM